MTWSQTLSDEAVYTQHPGFFRRQFGASATFPQKVFDALFGVVLPVLVLIVDPVVFQGGLFGDRPMLGDYQVFAYLISAVEIGLFLVWRTFPQIGAFAAPIGGALIGGAIFSFLVGVRILPLSLLGLMILIGAAGFTPFLTAFVYLRNGVRAINTPASLALQSRGTLTIGAALLSLALPYVASIQYSKMVFASVNAVINCEGQETQLAVNRLKRFPMIPHNARLMIVEAYGNEAHDGKKLILKQYWKDLTGEDIEYRMMIIND